MSIYRICKSTEVREDEDAFKYGWEAEAEDAKDAAQQYLEEFGDELADEVSQDGEELELRVLCIVTEVVTIRAKVEKELEIV